MAKKKIAYYLNKDKPAKISDLVARLVDMKNRHGDLEVQFSFESCSWDMWILEYNGELHISDYLYHMDGDDK